MLDILIPVLGRPQRVGPLLDNISATTDVPHRVLFLCSVGDEDEIAAVSETGANYLLLDAPPANGQFAKKINLGFRETSQEWLFLAADDVLFHPGWASIALRHAVHVISTNDRANYFVRQGLLAVHPLVRRTYIEEQGGSLDGPGSIYHEGYSHNFVDCELSVIARHRGVFAFARDSVVEHLHPAFGKAENDDTYLIGFRDFEQDRELFCRRMTGTYERDQLARRFLAANRQLARARRRRMR